MTSNNKSLKSIIDDIDISEDAYEEAVRRYEKLAEWLERDSDFSSNHSPEIFLQGSFRLGTAIKPINPGDAYDVDLGVKLQSGIKKKSYSQEFLKTNLGDDLYKYASKIGLKEEPKSKKRCWELQYQDDLNFHMDVVPAIPAEIDRVLLLNERIQKVSGIEPNLSRRISELAIDITDNTLSTYNIVSDDWEASNPQGYALWFESRLKVGKDFLRNRASSLLKESIDEVPMYNWNSPLQSVIKILKRHRDLKYKNKNVNECKPISIIITTLAARAYDGESDIKSALLNILDNMESLVSKIEPRVPNPVNPKEDFADKWKTEEGVRLDLEGNFFRWLMSAREEITAIINETSPINLSERLQRVFNLSIAGGVSTDVYATDSTRVLNSSSAPAFSDE